MVHLPCAKCKEEITNNDKFDCDACALTYHLTCDSVRKGDVTARASSKNLKLYCARCMTAKLDIANAEKLTILYRYITKIDEQTQKQIAIQEEVNGKLDIIQAESLSMKAEIGDLKNTITTHNASSSSCSNKTPETKSYASILKETKKTVIIVKPKNIII